MIKTLLKIQELIVSSFMCSPKHNLIVILTSSRRGILVVLFGRQLNLPSRLAHKGGCLFNQDAIRFCGQRVLLGHVHVPKHLIITLLIPLKNGSPF